jgi:hypothetical protein
VALDEFKGLPYQRIARIPQVAKLINLYAIASDLRRVATAAT